MQRGQSSAFFLVTLCVAFSLLLHGVVPAMGQSPTTAPVSGEDLERANTAMLRRVVDQQRVKIAELTERVASLEQQLQQAGLAVANASDAKQGDAVRGPPKRIIYLRIMNGREVRDEIVRAVSELQPDQWFNVFTPSGGKILPFRPALVQASDFNKKKLEEDLNPHLSVHGPFLDTLRVAAQFRPDSIWIVGDLSTTDEDASIEGFRKALAGSTTRLNTTTAFTTYLYFDRLHFLWRIAQETGGVCVNAQGEVIDEPVLPVKPAPLSVEEKPRKPAVLRESTGR